MTWSFALSGGGTPVVLPLAPNSVTDSSPAIVSGFPIVGAQSAAVSEGLDLRTVTLQGSIYVAGQTNSYLISNYLNPLRALIREEVVVVDPDGQFSGVWVFDVQFQRVAEGAAVRYTYTIKLRQGSSDLIL